MDGRQKKQLEALQAAPVNIRCRVYALRARGFVNRIFELSEAEEGGSVRRIFKCRYGLGKSLEALSRLSGIAAEKFDDIPWIYCATGDHDYFEAFRAVGVPIADFEEYKAYMHKGKGAEE